MRLADSSITVTLKHAFSCATTDPLKTCSTLTCVFYVFKGVTEFLMLIVGQRCFELLVLYQQPSAQYTKSISQPPLNRTGQTLMACTVADCRALCMVSAGCLLLLDWWLKLPPNCRLKSF